MTEEAKRVVAGLRYCYRHIHCYSIKDGERCPDYDSCQKKVADNVSRNDALADMIESLSAQLEQTENKLSELLYYATGGGYSKTDHSIDDMRRFVYNYNQSACNELEQVEKERDGLNIILAQAQEMLETRTKERDAAIADMQKTPITLCEACAHYHTGYPCSGGKFIDKINITIACTMFKWRGVQEVE